MSREESEYDKRAADRLIFFSDAVVAIAITLLAIDLPVPTGATAGEFWSSVKQHDGAYVSFLVSFYVIAAAWSHHHTVFKYLRTTDTRLRNLNLVWLLTIVLIPFATRLLTGYEQDTPAVHALRFAFYALLQTAASAALLLLGRHMAAAGLLADEAAPRAAAADWASYGMIIGFGLSIPVFFATTYGWVLWFAGPLLVPRLGRAYRRRSAAGE